MNVILFTSLLAFTLIFAWWRGDRDARIAALVCTLATLGTHLLLTARTQTFDSVEGGVMVIDVLTLTAFIGLALMSARFWPLWIAGLQLTASMAHLLKMSHQSLVPIAYAVAERAWGYPILIIITIGAHRAHRRSRAVRAMPDLAEASPSL